MSILIAEDNVAQRASERITRTRFTCARAESVAFAPKNKPELFILDFRYRSSRA